MNEGPRPCDVYVPQSAGTGNLHTNTTTAKNPKHCLPPDCVTSVRPCHDGEEVVFYGRDPLLR